MPIDHVGINISDFERAKSFYVAALQPLGYSLLAEFGGQAAGFGVEGAMPDFWIGSDPERGAAHFAFTAPDRATVDAFYDAAMSAGGTDNGPPGLRAHYHENYYSAYVHDPDGNNVEAVCHTPG
jgi:catechol 2,3-dioxygenase-like lactoylglutathione lyase family enzyme